MNLNMGKLDAAVWKRECWRSLVVTREQVMNHCKLYSLVLICVLGIQSAYAAQPPDSVQSDALFNTAMGTGALQSFVGDVCCNTAAGFDALYLNSEGEENTAFGTETLLANQTGSGNTAVGTSALLRNVSGSANTALGNGALQGCNACSQNTATGDAALGFGEGTANTATGFEAMYAASGNYNTATGAGAFSNNGGNLNTATGYQALGGVVAVPAVNSGNDNTATGANTLFSNTIGHDNTATGYDALHYNTSGYYNTATGQDALLGNTTGYSNTAAGQQALVENTTGNENTASGSAALRTNRSGSNNTAFGSLSLYSNTSGIDNTAIGKGALYNSTGGQNIAVGFQSGHNLTSGSNNVDIGNQGMPGESGVIRIGAPSTHAAAYVAGIYGTSVSGNAVVVSPTGQLGVVVSSERFKTAVVPMGDLSEKMQQLRPVSFHLKTDPEGPLQYGLIAEEVAKVYPDLVIRDGNGRIDGVRYDELAPMLLNEVQKLSARNDAQAAQIRDLKKMVLEMHAGLLKLQAEGELVARR